MEYFPAPLEKLVEQFARLPGIGSKSAQRLAFHVLNLPMEQAQEFANAIVEEVELPVWNRCRVRFRRLGKFGRGILHRQTGKCESGGWKTDSDGDKRGGGLRTETLYFWAYPDRIGRGNLVCHYIWTD